MVKELFSPKMEKGSSTLFLEVEHSGAVILHPTNSSQSDILQVKIPTHCNSNRLMLYIG